MGRIAFPMSVLSKDPIGLKKTKVYSAEFFTPDPSK